MCVCCYAARTPIIRQSCCFVGFIYMFVVHTYVYLKLPLFVVITAIADAAAGRAASCCRSEGFIYYY